MQPYALVRAGERDDPLPGGRDRQARGAEVGATGPREKASDWPPSRLYRLVSQLLVWRMLALLEPVMILGLGLIIGGIILSILMAILKVNSLVG